MSRLFYPTKALCQEILFRRSFEEPHDSVPCSLRLVLTWLDFQTIIAWNMARRPFGTPYRFYEPMGCRLLVWQILMGVVSLSRCRSMACRSWCFRIRCVRKII